MSEELSRGWVRTEREVALRRAHARQLVGARLAEVRYLTLDYRGWDKGYREGSTRAITDPVELHDPTRLGNGFHSVDQEVELQAADGRVFSIGWDTPGRESLRFRFGSQIPSYSGGAVWTVTQQPPWSACVGQTISDVLLHYHPWSDSEPGYWCTRATIVVEHNRVEIILGGWASPNSALGPAADNLAVLLDPDSLPDFERSLRTVEPL